MLKPQVLIYTEATPNPNSMKFVVNFELVPEGVSFDYATPAEALQPEKNSPLAVELFGFDWVERVFLSYNFVTVTKVESVGWEEVLFEAKLVIRQYLEAGKKALTPAAARSQADAPETPDTETVQKIKAVLEQYVQPAVEMDGGAIRFHAFDEATGTVRLLMQGSCSGCPSSTLTLKSGIENLLTRLVPEVQQVEAEGV